MKCGYDPAYVLDKMEMYELNAAMKYSYHCVKDEWEQARLIAYVVAQTQSTKRIKMEDIMKFPWEEEQDEHDTKVTKEQVEMLKAQAAAYLKSQNKRIEKRDKNG